MNIKQLKTITNEILGGILKNTGIIYTNDKYVFFNSLANQKIEIKNNYNSHD